MKKTVVTFGLISGAISSLLMLATVPLRDRIGFDDAEIFGYTLIVASFLLVFFAIRSYRDNICKGQISFGRAFAIGICITLITCLFYVATWEILYYTVLHNFMSEYAAHLVEKAKASGMSPTALQAQLQQVNKYKRLYENPLFNSAITFTEPFPVGLVVTLISAGVLRRKAEAEEGAVAAA